MDVQWLYDNLSDSLHHELLASHAVGLGQVIDKCSTVVAPVTKSVVGALDVWVAMQTDSFLEVIMSSFVI